MNFFPKIQKAWEWRKDYVKKNNLDAFRLLNAAGDDCPGLLVDYYAGAFQIVYKEPSLFEFQSNLHEALLKINSEISDGREHYFFEVKNFALSDPGAAKCFAGKQSVILPIQKKALLENDLKYEIHLGEGLHTGLFLDQRENRQWIISQSEKKRVLNLFSYTGAFTVAALSGGASEVVSVDLSKNYLDWLKRNVELNGLKLSQAPVWPREVFDYLQFAQKKREKFDVIIVDPPTFSRHRKQVFSTEKDLKQLIAQILPLLSNTGKIFLSINTLKLNQKTFEEEVSEALQGGSLQILKKFALPRDFKLSETEKKNPYLKACWIG